MKKISIGITSLVVGVVLLTVLFGVYKRNSDIHPVQRACTSEALLCPDGSAVGRTAPNCEFAPCPDTQLKTETALIRVEQPLSGETIISPLVVSGVARGTWYFEATFPIVLEDANGKTIATGNAQAQGEWMTENFVPFTASLSFVSEKEQQGTIVVKKSNPSGLSENAHEVRIPVLIEASPNEQHEKGK